MNEKLRVPAVARLNNQQVRLLELVAVGTTSSKALAAATGLSPGSIDTYLHAAARELGCEGRVATARRYAEIQAESSQSNSQLRARAVVSAVKSGAYRLASTLWRFFTGPPLGGSTHPASSAYVSLQVVRVGVIGAVGMTLLVLFLLGFLKVFG